VREETRRCGRQARVDTGEHKIKSRDILGIGRREEEKRKGEHKKQKARRKRKRRREKQ
jgi:hypothetical protein